MSWSKPVCAGSAAAAGGTALLQRGRHLLPVRRLGLRQGVLNTEQITLNPILSSSIMINILIYSVIYLKKEGLKIIVSAVQEINLLDLNLGRFLI